MVLSGGGSVLAHGTSAERPTKTTQVYQVSAAVCAVAVCAVAVCVRLRGHQGAVLALTSSSRDQMISCGRDGVVLVWKITFTSQ